MNKYKQLTLEQRYEISVLYKQKFLKSMIAEIIGVDKSTITRELQRNSKVRSYNAEYAQKRADIKRKQARKAIKLTEEMKKDICQLLNRQFSPEQIAGIKKLQGKQTVSHESIYRYIWKDKKQGGKLYLNLRNSSKKYKKRYNATDKRGIIPNKKMIDQRPKIVDERSRLGDWEIDTVIGSNHKGALVTIVERKSSYLKMAIVKSKKADLVSNATIDLLKAIDEQVLTITSDNGKEFANHQNIASELNADFYFANPYHSWERGLNEYTNKLIRQYFPKKYDFTLITREQVEKVEELLNNRPRKKMGFKTPNQIFYARL